MRTWRDRNARLPSSADHLLLIALEAACTALLVLQAARAGVGADWPAGPQLVGAGEALRCAVAQLREARGHQSALSHGFVAGVRDSFCEPDAD